MKKEGFGIFVKLLSGFLLVISVTGLGNFYSLTQMNRLSGLTTKIFNHPLQVTRAVLSADTNIVKIHRSMKDVALADSKAELESAFSLVNDYEKIVYRHLGIVEKWILGEKGAFLHAETAQLFRDWKPIRDEVIALTKNGKKEQAFAITKGKGADHVEKLNRKMEELKRYAASKASGMLNESQKTNKTIINTTSIIFIILVVLSGLFGYFLSRLIAKEINERKKVQDKLQQSEERYRVVSENFPNGAVILFDKSLKFVLAGGAILRDVGLTSKDMVGRNVQDTLPPDRAEELIPYYKSALNGKFEKFDYEYGGLDFEVYTLPVNDSEGNVTFGMSMSQNVTVRKQAEDRIKASLKEKETLLQEIHHRVKNNMQVINSMLKLQANNIEDDRIKDILKDSQSRIYAMSAVHETLHGSEKLSEIDLKSYLHNVTTSIFNTFSTDSRKIKLKSDVEESPISLNQAYPLGLVINELISNSMKYGFPGDRTGEITVKMQKLEDGLMLTVSDDGIGMPKGFDWRKSNTLGLQLIKDLIEKQLKGAIDLDRTNGTKFTIKF